MDRKAKYATKKGAKGEQMAIRPLQILGLILVGYGFLVLTNPSEYAQWIIQWVELKYTSIAGFIFVGIGIWLMTQRRW
jgi:hypothetical protein